MLSFAIISITLALFWYTIAVWAERISRKLKKWHVLFFWIGVISDSSGTIAMFRLNTSNFFDIHGLTGEIALFLMLFHATWATIVIIKKNEKLISNFHKFSLFVWLVWLVPYLTGIFMHMK
jgi:uncharacterized repeat protein (TIGR03987 family)